jgi:hypothetical protein
MKEWALDTAKRGFPVFQLLPNHKEPQHSGSFKHATVDPILIEEMWDELPDCNIGVYPGTTLCIIDIDKKPGKDGVESILADLGDCLMDYLYETFSVRTQGGGYHLYYTSELLEGYKSTVGNADTLMGVDVRAVGGYVVGPGSIVDGKTYDIISDTPPKKLHSRWPSSGVARAANARTEERDTVPIGDLDTPDRIQEALDCLRVSPPAISGEGGNHLTFATLARVRDIGISQDKALELAGEWNLRCEPPWSYDELEVLANNVWAYAQNTPGEQGTVLLDEFAKDFGEQLLRFQKIGDLESKLTGRALVNELARVGLWGGAAIKTSSFKREMIIPHWIPAHGFTGLLAPRNTGKTVFMIDLAHKLACDEPWYGEQAREGMTSFYICGEDIEGASQYAKAWMKYHKKEPAENRICLLPLSVDLLSEQSTMAFTLNMLEEAEARGIQEGKFMIFIDTWQRATSRGGMNNDEDMQEAVRNCEALGRAVNGPVMVAFHPSKHGGMADISGSAVVGNASTAILKFQELLGVKNLKIDRIKGGKDGLVKSFDFKVVDLDEKDEYGLKIDSVVMIEHTKEKEPEDDSPEQAKLKTWAEAIVRVHLSDDGIKPNRTICRQILALNDIPLHQRLSDQNEWYKGKQGGLPVEETVIRHIFGYEKLNIDRDDALLDTTIEVTVDDDTYKVAWRDGKFTVAEGGVYALPEPPDLD